MRKYLDSNEIIGFHLIKKISGLVLYIERERTWLHNSSDYYVRKANKFEITKLGLKSNVEKDYGHTDKLTGKFFFKKCFSGMVLFVEYNKLIGIDTRKATEIDLVNLKLYR